MRACFSVLNLCGGKRSCRGYCDWTCQWEKLSKQVASVSCHSASGGAAVRALGDRFKCEASVCVDDYFPSDNLSIQIRFVSGASY